MGMDEERKARLGKMVATAQLMLALIKGVVNVGVILSLKLILKSWQLCLSFKLDVLTTYAPTSERNINHELFVCFSHSSLYVPNNLYLIILIVSF